MNKEKELTEALLDGYRKAKEEVGYKATRFLQAVRRNGGLKTAKRMLKPRTAEQRKGLDKLIEEGRHDLTVEAIILRPKFKMLFTKEELNIAKERLGEYGKEVAKRIKKRERLFPDELEPGEKYIAGAKKQIRVNAYERDTRARKACLNHYGYRCSVCNLLFEEMYGDVGKDFIHVHHLVPLSLTNTEYELNPIKDLRPVCPNCHAMLHKTEKVLSISQLRKHMEK